MRGDNDTQIDTRGWVAGTGPQESATSPSSKTAPRPFTAFFLKSCLSTLVLGTLYFAPLTAAGVQLWGEETTGSLKGDSRSTDSEGERACRRCPRVVTNSRRKTQTRERDRWLDARESALWPAIAPLALAVPSRATLVAWPWRASAYSSTGRSKIHRLEVPHKKRLERERERERERRARSL